MRYPKIHLICASVCIDVDRLRFASLVRLFRQLHSDGGSYCVCVYDCAVLFKPTLGKFLPVARFQIHFFFLGNLDVFFLFSHRNTHEHSTVHKTAQRVLCFLFVWCVVHSTMPRIIFVYVSMICLV